MDKIERGNQAGALLSNEVFNDVLRELETSYVTLWKTGQTIEVREDLHRYIVMIAQIKNDMRSIMITGQIERRRQDELSGKPTTVYAPMWRDQRGG